MAGFLGRLLQRAAAVAPALVPRHPQAYETVAAAEPGVAAVVERPAWPAWSDATGDAMQRPAGAAAHAPAVERFSLRGGTRASSAGAGAMGDRLADDAPASPGRVPPAVPSNGAAQAQAPRHVASGVAAPGTTGVDALLPTTSRGESTPFGATQPQPRMQADHAPPPRLMRLARLPPVTRDAPGRDPAQPASAGLHAPQQRHPSNDAPASATDPGASPDHRGPRLPTLTPALTPPPAPGADPNAVRGVLLVPPVPSQPALALDTAPAPAASDPATPTIHVTIGRIELRATAPAHAGAAPPRAAAAPPPAALSLADYLARRQGGGSR